jgi:hypothetical protein
MQLQDFENSCLGPLQQSAMINFGGAPNWTAGVTGNQQPQFPQSMIDFQINRAYIDLMQAFSECELGFYQTTFLSVANALKYPLPPPPENIQLNWDSGLWDEDYWAPAPILVQPPIHRLAQLYYAPQNLMYNLEFEPGIRMIPWKEFQRYTAAGYLEQYSFGTQPEVCSVEPSRQFLWFYPGTANAGDVITINYIPIPTAGSQVPLMVAETDSPLILPDDVQELIPYYALWKLLPRARDASGAAFYQKFYLNEIERLKNNYLRSSGANRLRFTDATADRATSGPYDWIW